MTTENMTQCIIELFEKLTKSENECSLTKAEKEKADARIAELEAALEEVKVRSNTYAQRLVNLGYHNVSWYAKDSLAKENK
jgi:hypothetical protein